MAVNFSYNAILSPFLGLCTFFKFLKTLCRASNDPNLDGKTQVEWVTSFIDSPNKQWKPQCMVGVALILRVSGFARWEQLAGGCEPGISWGIIYGWWYGFWKCETPDHR